MAAAHLLLFFIGLCKGVRRSDWPRRHVAASCERLKTLDHVFYHSFFWEAQPLRDAWVVVANVLKVVVEDHEGFL